jgi:phenylacetate-CoA ligase
MLLVVNTERGNMDLKRRKEGFFDKELETLSPQKREDHLSKKFLDFVQYAFEHSPYFRKRLDERGIRPADIQGLQDLERIPLIRKDDLAARQKEVAPFGGFETISPPKAQRIYINPGLVFQPALGEHEIKSWSEALYACGMRPGDIVQNTFNYHGWPVAFTLDDSLRELGITGVPSGAGNTLMQIRVMQALAVTGFIGTPSFLMTVADRAEAMGIDLKKELNLEVGFCTAEMLPEGLRQRLEGKFDMMVRQGYGTVFTGCLGYECYYKNGLHLPQDILVEIVDPQTGKPVEPGATGEIVATNFNPFFPMIRFATGDLSLLVTEACPCGRTSFRLKKILGRVDQATKVRGTFIHPWQTDELAAQFPEIFKYQVIVARKDHTDIMTFVAEVKDETVDKTSLKGRLEKAIREMLALKAEVEVVPPGSIPDWHQKIVDRRTWE